MQRERRVMVLCAGFGTRLRPLTSERPKPLVPVGDRPLLGHLVAQLERAGAQRVVINAHHLHDEFTKHTNELSLPVEVIYEPQIRGTAGGIAGARGALGPGQVVVWNGDIQCEPPLELLFGCESPLTLVVAARQPGQGSVGLGVGGNVVRLRGELFGKELSGGDYVGVAALSAATVNALPNIGCLIGDVALPMLRRGAPVHSLPLHGNWSDLGTLNHYLNANYEWLERLPARNPSDPPKPTEPPAPTSATPALPELAATLAGAGSWVGSGAVVEPGVSVDRTVVGAGARVTGNGALVGCVVWPGAHAVAPAEATVFGLTFRAALED